MRDQIIGFVTMALFAPLAYAQSPAEESLDRVLQFAHTESAQDLQEITTVIRGIAQIPEATTDTAQRTLAVRGTASQIALAEWLFNELDRPYYLPTPDSLQFPVSDGGKDVVQIRYLQSINTVQQLQEVATLVRSIADIRQLFTYNAPKVVVLRGTADQLALAGRLFYELVKPVSPLAEQSQFTPRQYRMPGGTDDIVQMVYLTHIETVQYFQELATLVRSLAEIRRLFTEIGPRAIAMRGTTDQLALAEWLFHTLDNPANHRSADAESRNAVVREYRFPGGVDDVVRVIYTTHTPTVKRFQEIATQVRSMTGVRRLFTYNAPRALALRGTAEQIALADRLIKERDR